jgi:hypothetical protein
MLRRHCGRAERSQEDGFGRTALSLGTFGISGLGFVWCGEFGGLGCGTTIEFDFCGLRRLLGLVAILSCLALLE